MTPNQAAPVPLELDALLRAAPVRQGDFAWSREPWRVQAHDLPEVLAMLEALPDRVDRHSVREVVLEEFRAGNALSAFVAAMIWGYGTTGYGPGRVRWVLTGTRGTRAVDEPILATVATRLTAGATTVREAGPLEGYRAMNNELRIKFLGGAFFTKWLYFVSAVEGPYAVGAAPILDRQVASWLDRNQVMGLNIRSTASYARYLELLAAWGEQYGRSRVQVEQAIFGLATGRV